MRSTWYDDDPTTLHPHVPARTAAPARRIHARSHKAMLVAMLVGLVAVTPFAMRQAVQLRADRTRPEPLPTADGQGAHGFARARVGLHVRVSEAAALKELTLGDAVREGSPAAVGRALARQDNPDARDASGDTLLVLAVSRTTTAPVSAARIIELLLAAGADPNLEANGVSPLATAVRLPEPRAIVALLLERSAADDGDALGEALDRNVDARDAILPLLMKARFRHGAGAIALEHAKGDRDASIIKQLAARGIDWSHEDSRGRTLLVRAIDLEDGALVKALLDARAPVNAATSSGQLPLYAAVRKALNDDSRRSVRLVELLLARGARLKANPGVMARLIAQARSLGRGDLVQLLTARGEKLPPTVTPARDAETDAALRILTAALAEQTL